MTAERTGGEHETQDPCTLITRLKYHIHCLLNHRERNQRWRVEVRSTTARSDGAACESAPRSRRMDAARAVHSKCRAVVLRQTPNFISALRAIHMPRAPERGRGTGTGSDLVENPPVESWIVQWERSVLGGPRILGAGTRRHARRRADRISSGLLAY